MDITTPFVCLCVIMQTIRVIYEVDIGIKRLACGLGTVRTGLEGLGPVKVKMKKENTNKPAIQGPQWSCVCYQSSASEVGDTVALYSGIVASVYDE